MRQQELQLSEFPMPNTQEIEMKLLASIIADSTIMPQVMRVVNRDMFSNADNQKMWDIMLAMWNEGEKINLISIQPRVNQKYFIDNFLMADVSAYGSNSLNSLINAFVDTYAKRCAYMVSIDTLQKINNGCSYGEVIDGMASAKERILKGFKDTTSKDTKEIANVLKDKLLWQETNRIPTSMRTIDYLTYGGFGGGNLVILAARPSVGKTQIGLQIAMNASVNGKKSMIFSLEMSGEELVQRLILSTGLITPMEFFSRNFEIDKYDKAVEMATNENLIINDKSNGIDEICQKIRVEAQTNGCKLVMIDYLGLIPITDKRANTATAIGEMTRKLKLTAKECNIPILLLCQLNRQSASEGRSPQLYDLRDSGAIEQDADMVIMLEKAKGEDGEIMDNTIDLWVRKNRNGKCNFDNPIRLYGNETYSSFQEDIK